MKRMIVISMILCVILYVFYKMALPDFSVLNNMFILIFVSIIIFPFTTQRFLLRKAKFGYISLGLVFFIVMWGILIIGNANYYILDYLYNINYNILAVNLYWILGMLFFALGYLLSKDSQIKEIRNSQFGLEGIANLTFFFGLLGTLLILFQIGYVPIFQNQKGVQIDLIGGSISIRLWSLNVLSGMVFFYLIIRKRSIKYLVPFIISASSTIILNQRMHIFAVLLGCILIYLYFAKSSRKLMFAITISFIGYMLLNTLFLENRKAERINFGVGVSTFQTKYVRRSFNEYVQLARLIDEYDGLYLKGETLLNIPVGFIPSFFLSPLGINKSDILHNNSAVIMASIIGAKESTGIRTGIYGELYLNFSYWGVVLFIFLGIFVSYINNKINKIGFNNFWAIILLAMFVVLLYSLVGQINAISSLFFNYLILGWIIIFLNKQLRRSH